MSFKPRFENLVDIYESSVKAFPSNPLFGTKKNGAWEWLTFGEFEKLVEGFRGGLASLGVERGDRIAIIANNRVEWAVAAYATYGLGAAFVPMYEAQLSKDWEYIVRDCEAKVLICATAAIVDKAKSFLDEVPSLKNIISFADVDKASDPRITSYQALLDLGKKVPLARPAKEDIAGLIYTSGTTGNPKGVILTHLNLASNVSAMHEVFPMAQSDRSLSFLPWAHSFGQTCELHALLSMGASLAIAESVEKIIDNLGEVSPTLLFSVPRIFNKIYAGVQKTISSKPGVVQSMVRVALKARAKQRAGENLGFVEGFVTSLADKLVFSKVRAKFGGRLRYAFSGGAAISKEVAEFIDSLGVMVYEGYGLTETSPISTANWPDNRRIGSVGKAVPGVRIVIDPTGMDPRPDGRGDGEILVYGLNVMKGYYNRDDENALVMTNDGGFRTGDMGYLDKDGYLYISGRIKEQYKLENGKYVVPTPLEENLKLSSWVANVMVYGDNKPFNVALVVANMDPIKKWASENGVSGDGDALLANAQVRERFKKEIEQYSDAFKGFESIQDFALISDDFTAENGMLTPSLKLKRRKVLEVHGKLIEELYAKKREKKAPSATATA